MSKIKPRPIIVRSDNAKPAASGVSAMALDEIVEVSVPFLGDMPDAETLPEITHKKVKCFAVYCDSIRWDGHESTMDKTGDGSAQRPYRNARYALQQILCTLEKTCFLPMFILYITGEVNYAVSHKALCDLKMWKDLYDRTYYTRLNNRNFFRKRLIISGEKAEGGKLRIAPELLAYDAENNSDSYPGSCYREMLIYSSCIPQALLTQHIIFDHSKIYDVSFYTSGTFFDCEFINVGYRVGSTGWATGRTDFYQCKFINSTVSANKIYDCEVTTAQASEYCVATKSVVENTSKWSNKMREMASGTTLKAPIIRDCTVVVKDLWSNQTSGEIYYIVCDCDSIINTEVSVDIFPAKAQIIRIYGTSANKVVKAVNSTINISCNCANMGWIDSYRDLYCYINTGVVGSPVPTTTNFPVNLWRDVHFNYIGVHCLTGTEFCSLTGTKEEWFAESWYSDYWVRHVTSKYQEKTVKLTDCIIRYNYIDDEVKFAEPTCTEKTETISGCE